jgi:hypothetical protein
MAVEEDGLTAEVEGGTYVIEVPNAMPGTHYVSPLSSCRHITDFQILGIRRLTSNIFTTIAR